MIDVHQLIAKYTLEELNESADLYYKSLNPDDIAKKPFRIPEIIHLLVEVSYLIYGLDICPGDRVLDFGCGTGWTSRILHACGCDVVGVDVSETALMAARSHFQRWRTAGIIGADEGVGLDFVRFNGVQMEVADSSIDKIFVLDAFHHVSNQASVLGEFARILKPGGTAGFCEPGPRHSQNPESQREMTLHKVIENDIVLSEIYSCAQGLGFDRLRVGLSPLHPMVVEYEEYAAFPSNAKVVNRFVEATDWRVKNYPIFFLKKRGVAALDSRGIEGLCVSLSVTSPSPIVCRAGALIEIRLRAKNIGTAVWLPSGTKPGSVSIGIIVTGDNGSATHHRSHLSSVPVAPGTHVEAVAVVPALSKGKYTIELDLVSEHITWFKNLGNSDVNIRVSVT